MDNNNSVWRLINDLATKKGITEVVINSIKDVFVEREGQFIKLNAPLREQDIDNFVSDIADFNKKRCDPDHPLFDGLLPDGSRINIVLPPFAAEAPAITIRRYRREIKTFKDSAELFSLPLPYVELFSAMVKARVNIVVSGGTGVGKTTLMNLLLQELPKTERVVTIEDTRELNFSLPNLVKLEMAKGNTESQVDVSTRDLVKNSLRMRPDRIVIGEVRGGELFDLLQAMNTGHEGSMCSIHASSTGECISRMETLFLLAGFDIPYHVVRAQIASAVNFVIQLSRTREGKRVIGSISEITGMESDRVLMQTVATFEDGRLRATGITPKCIAKLAESGGLPTDFFSTLT